MKTKRAGWFLIAVQVSFDWMLAQPSKHDGYG
jgi:hypothetical protein